VFVSVLSPKHSFVIILSIVASDIKIPPQLIEGESYEANAIKAWNSIISVLLTFVPEFLLLFLIVDVGNEAMSGSGSDMVV
jgi:hypothetical protein